MTWETFLAESRHTPLIMGVLNVTPDSFSDGGKFADPAAAIDHGLQMAQHGAQIIDIGGESTRPGAQRIDAEEQIRRVLPVIGGLARQVPCLLSIDTTRSAVAQAALDAGAHWINDISAGVDDPPILQIAAKYKARIILMHMLGQPATMQISPSYRHVVAEVSQHLLDRAGAAMDAGVDRSHILLDPGIGFGKTVTHNLQLLRRLPDLAALGYPLVVGVSRKAFIGRITGEPEASNRVMGTAAAISWAAANGAAVLRVHDVEPMSQVIRMICAIKEAPAE